MITAQRGFGDEYGTANLGLITGTEWDDGSGFIAYNYSKRDNLAGTDRDFVRRDHRHQGGSNFQSFNCSPATIQPGGSGPIYLSATSDTAVANNSDNAPCDPSVYSDIFGEEVRHNFMAKVNHEISDRLSLSLSGVYSDRAVTSNVARGTLTATVYRTADQANPYYVNPPGIDPDSPEAERQAI